LIKDIYNDIIEQIKEILHNGSQLSIRDIIKSPHLANHDFENVIALIKFLISKEFLEIKKKSSLNNLSATIVTWNDTKSDLKIPERELREFNSIKLCMTFPPFDLSGLSTQMKQHDISMGSLIEEFSHLFSKAKTTIKICSPFLEYNGFEYFKERLIKKARARVNIKMLSRQIKIGEKNSRYYNIKKIYDCFQQEGLEQYIDIRNYYYKSMDDKLVSSIHAKMIIVDDSFSYIGSGELRKNSFTKNFETGVILTGSKVIETAIIFDKIFSKSEVVKFV